MGEDVYLPLARDRSRSPSGCCCTIACDQIDPRDCCVGLVTDEAPH